MALKNDYTVIVGGKDVLFSNAYHQITFDNGTKYDRFIEVTTFSTPKKDHVVQRKQYRFVPSVEDNAPNFIKQGYEYLKTLPDYVDAFDVLE